MFQNKELNFRVSDVSLISGIATTHRYSMWIDHLTAILKVKFTTSLLNNKQTKVGK